MKLVAYCRICADRLPDIGTYTPWFICDDCWPTTPADEIPTPEPNTKETGT